MAMDAARLREILKTQYGIESESDFDEAVEKSSGVNLGIFAGPLERSRNGYKEKAAATA